MEVIAKYTGRSVAAGEMKLSEKKRIIIIKYCKTNEML